MSKKSKKNLLSEENIKNLPKSTITPYEAKVLRLYLAKSVNKIAEEIDKEPTDIYGVFRTIRDRRKRVQLTVNFWNNVARDRRLYYVLTPRKGPDTEEEED